MNYFALGWDVGGWNCDKNPNSRDALVLLDHNQQQIGQMWRGNLRHSLNTAQTAQAWLSQIAQLLCLPKHFFDQHNHPIYLGIDTPLGVSIAWQELIFQFKAASDIGDSADNPYLYRETERWLLKKGFKPLSAIKDMIGSQATKGRHFLARFTPYQQSCGIWQDEHSRLIAFEAYPTLAKKSPGLNHLFKQITWQNAPPEAGDAYDAAFCALIAAQQASAPANLVRPPDHTPWSEGWIFIPNDLIAPLTPNNE